MSEIRAERRIRTGKGAVADQLFGDTPAKETDLPDDVEIERILDVAENNIVWVVSSTEWEEQTDDRLPEFTANIETIPPKEEPELDETGPYEAGDPYELGDGLEQTHDIVTEDRNDTHGDPYDNHKQIAELWSAFLQFKLSEEIRGWEAAIMMQHVKQSRMQAGRLTGDHFDDTMGYGEVGKYSAVKDPEVEISLDE